MKHNKAIWLILLGTVAVLAAVALILPRGDAPAAETAPASETVPASETQFSVTTAKQDEPQKPAEPEKAPDKAPDNAGTDSGMSNEFGVTVLNGDDTIQEIELAPNELPLIIID